MIKELVLIIGCLICFFPGKTQSEGKVYTGALLKSLRVPVGGIGTGNILIGGRGDIAHVEIFNRPDRRRRLEKTFFAVWAKKGEERPVAKLLEREILPPYVESTHKYVAGLPRMREAEFIIVVRIAMGWTNLIRDI